MAGRKTGSLTPITKAELVASDGTRAVRVPPPSVNGHVLTADDTQPAGMKWDAPPAGGGGGSTGRTCVSFTTAVLADDDAETGTVALAKSFLLFKVQVSGAARVQIYSSEAARDADAGRAVGTPPTPGTSHGLIGEWYLDGVAAPLTFIASPEMPGVNSTDDVNIAYRVTNLSGGAAAITVTLCFVPCEPLAALARASVSITTGSLDDGDAETGTVAIAQAFLLYKVQASCEARVEVYSSEAARDADATRGIGANPPVGSSHGVIGDWYLDDSAGAPLTFIASPELVGVNSTADANIAYRITNKSGGTTTITVTFYYVPVEV